MAEELQHLIERIQREAVDTGEQQATQIVGKAKEKAAAIIKDAEANAAAILDKAEKDAEQFTVRGQQALAQSARDLLITVGQGVEKIFEELIVRSVDDAMDDQSMRDLIARVVEAYIKEGDSDQALEVVLSDDDKTKLESFFRQKFAEELKAGVDVTSDTRMTKGFKVRLSDKNIQHDFSREAIAEAVSVFLRPVLAETVYKIAREQG